MAMEIRTAILRVNEQRMAMESSQGVTASVRRIVGLVATSEAACAHIRLSQKVSTVSL
jgi:hypothetical protein